MTQRCVAQQLVNPFHCGSTKVTCNWLHNYRHIHWLYFVCSTTKQCIQHGFRCQCTSMLEWQEHLPVFASLLWKAASLSRNMPVVVTSQLLWIDTIAQYHKPATLRQAIFQGVCQQKCKMTKEELQVRFVFMIQRKENILSKRLECDHGWNQNDSNTYQ